MNFILNFLIRLKIYSINIFLKRSMLKLANDPRSAQWKTLSDILKKQSETDFGRKYEFSKITSIEDFQDKIPISEYEDIRCEIDEQRIKGVSTLNSKTVDFYATTSGTTGLSKFIPITRDILNQHKESQKIISHTIFKSRPKTYEGKFLAIVSPAIEGYFENGTLFGSVSGLAQKTVPSLIRKKYLLPYSVLEIKDPDAKYLLIAMFCASDADVTLFATANPSTVLRLLDIINDNIDDILEVIAHGDINLLTALPRNVAKKYAHFFKADKKRAKHLTEVYKKNTKLQYSDIWPKFQTLACWTKGSCAVLIPRIKKLLPDNSQVFEVGYISSEFRGTLMAHSDDSGGLPTLNHNFFEFVEKDKWENKTKEFLTLDQLKEKERYYIFATTCNGLYRYNINDIIEVNGFFKKTPLLSFVQKGKGVTNITGEKLYESQISDATLYAQETLSGELVFFIAIADPLNLEYQLFIEDRTNVDTVAFSDLVEKKLSELNMEYATKRESKRLKKMRTYLLKTGAFEAFKSHSIAFGQREGQFKVVTLQYKDDCKFRFDEWVSH